MATSLAWLVFTLTGGLALVYKAVMATPGGEQNIRAAVRDYYGERRVATAVRLVLVQIFFFAVWDQPELVGDLFGKAAGVGTAVPLPTRWWLAGLLGLASDKIADVLMAGGGWIYRRCKSFFANGSTAPPSP